MLFFSFQFFKILRIHIPKVFEVYATFSPPRWTLGLGCSFYFVPKKLGYPKTGKYLTLTFGLLVSKLVLWTVFEDQLFTKGNAKELVEEQQILLDDKFELKENKSMSAIGTIIALLL